MGLRLDLTQNQIKQMASYISLKDIEEYINSHLEEYEQYLKEEENQTTKNSNIKSFTKFQITKEINSFEKLKKYNTTYFIVWQEYKEE